MLHLIRPQLPEAEPPAETVPGPAARVHLRSFRLIHHVHRRRHLVQHLLDARVPSVSWGPSWVGYGAL